MAPPRGGGERNLPVPAAPGGDGSGGGGPVVPAGLRSPIPTYTTDRLGHRQRGRLSDRFPLGNNLGRKKNLSFSIFLVSREGRRIDEEIKKKKKNLR